MDRQTLRNRDWEFEHEVLRALTVLREIASGETKRGRCLKHTMEPGNRPMKMKEAMLKAANAQHQLNAAVNKFNDSQPKPWDWDRFENKEP